MKYTFTYNKTVTNVFISADALLGPKGFLEAKIFPLTENSVCYHVWGIVTKPRSSRMECW
jgi:hypothetical protein